MNDPTFHEDVPTEEHLTHEERYLTDREHPSFAQETNRGIVEYHNELADYDQHIDPEAMGMTREEIVKQTIIYKLISRLWVTTQQPIYLLDLGCGSGRFLKELKEVFGNKVEVYGVTARAYDNAGKPILDNTKEREYLEEQRKSGVNIQIGDMGDLSDFKGEFFDVVVSAEGINYAGDPIRVVERSMRILKKEGLLVAGPVASSFEGLQQSVTLAGNSLLHHKLGFSGIRRNEKVEGIPIMADVICLSKEDKFNNPRVNFSHSAKSKNGAVYRVQ